MVHSIIKTITQLTGFCIRVKLLIILTGFIRLPDSGNKLDKTDERPK